jgi:hypothetical protein
MRYLREVRKEDQKRISIGGGTWAMISLDKKLVSGSLGYNNNTQDSSCIIHTLGTTTQFPEPFVIGSTDSALQFSLMLART